MQKAPANPGGRIAFQCPYCGKWTNYAAAMAGKEAKCRHCGKKISVDRGAGG